MRFAVLVVLLWLVPLTPAAEPKGTPVEPWEMGPFVKREKSILSPTADSVFTCPILKKEVKWESQNVYNPAAVVRDGKVYLLYGA
jgi:hypothetical protein